MSCPSAAAPISRLVIMLTCGLSLGFAVSGAPAATEQHQQNAELDREQPEDLRAHAGNNRIPRAQRHAGVPMRTKVTLKLGT